MVSLIESRSGLVLKQEVPQQVISPLANATVTSVAQVQAAQQKPVVNTGTSSGQVPVTTQDAIVYNYMLQGKFGSKSAKKKRINNRSDKKTGFDKLIDDINSRRSKKIFQDPKNTLKVK
jgi:hypothetical protein